MENETKNMFKNSDLLTRPSHNFNVDPSTIEGRDPNYHYAFLRCDNGKQIPPEYEVVNTELTGEKSVSGHDGVRVEKGNVYLQDTVLCRTSLENYKKKEAIRKYRASRVLSLTRKRNEDNLKNKMKANIIESSMQIEKG